MSTDLQFSESKGGYSTMKADEFKDIIYEKDDETGIVTVTLNTPKRKNALSFYTFLELFWAVDAMEKDETARVMILTGAQDPDSPDPNNEAFSSGGYFNISALDNISDEIRKQIDLTDIAQKKLTLKMFEFDKPVIAAINGLAIGAGFTMPLSCADLIYMSEHAWIRLPFANLGIIPEFALTYFLPRMIGAHRAKEIIYFSEKITANQALELGLVNKVLPHIELLPFAREMALRLIPPEGAGLAIRLAKRAFHRPYIDAVKRALDIENEGLNKSVTTADFNEAMLARMEKRKPVFKGE
jgi:enoyl-CoA hydratase/carnithine racemase